MSENNNVKTNADSPNSSNQICFKIGSRDSQLAMKQTYQVQDGLKKLYPDASYPKIISMKTLGDKILDVSLSKIGSKSLFTKELEQGLSDDHFQMVVHSLKDLPTTAPPGLVVGGVLQREDPRDAVVMRGEHAGRGLADLPKGSVLGTSSVRRTAQLLRTHPHLTCESVRGNLNTRLNKLDAAEKKYDALVLAAAGVLRMGWEARLGQYLEESSCLYAVGQGALAVQCRDSDCATLAALHRLCHADTLLAVVAERALLAALEGGCSTPVGVWSELKGNRLTLKAGIWSLDGQQELKEEMTVELSHYLDESLENGKSKRPHVESSDEVSQCSKKIKSDVSTNGDANGHSHAKDTTEVSNGSRKAEGTFEKDTQKRSQTISSENELKESSDGKSKSKEESLDETKISSAGKSESTETKSCENESSKTEDSSKASTKEESSEDDSPKATTEQNGVTTFSGILPPAYLVVPCAEAHRLGQSVAMVLRKRGASDMLVAARAENAMEAPNVTPVRAAGVAVRQ